jgi:uncharacterized protein (DUF362 family)
VSRVFIDRVSQDNYLDVVRAGLEYAKFGELVSPSTKVFIKPNLTFPEYKPGVMTNPKCVEAVVLAIRDYTSHVYIGDSDSGGYNRFAMDDVYEATGIRQLVEATGAKLVNLSLLPTTPVPIELGRRTVQLPLPTLLTDEIDLLVTVPVPKIHMNTQVSLTYKNQWGCIPEPHDRLRLHPDFARVILAVNDAVKTKFAVVDGLYGLDRSGPLRGDVVDLGWLMASDDIGAAAQACCRLMQVPVRKVPQLRLAAKQGRLPDPATVSFSNNLDDFLTEPFHLRREWTDYPGVFAFNSRAIAYVGYFSPVAELLHKLLYKFREPFYEYDYAAPTAPTPEHQPEP